MMGIRFAGLCGSTAVAALMLFAAPTAVQAQTQTFKFDLPVQSLGGALRAFGQQSHQQIIFSEDDVRGKSSPASWRFRSSARWRASTASPASETGRT